MKRRVFVQSAAAWVAAAAVAPGARAQDPFPSKPIRFIVPTAAGSATDAVGRAYGERMAKVLKQPVIVEPMPGAGTLLAMRHMLKAPPDGYTLCISANTLVTLPYVDKSAGFTPGDFAGVSNFAVSPMALVVGADSPYKTLNDLVAAAKRSPGALSFASVGVGTTSHLPVELFAQSAGIRMELIPYKGIPLAIPDVASGRVTLMMGTSASAGELVKAGKLRALAVTSERRTPSFPGVPTFAELGHEEASYELFLGLVGVTKVPMPIRRQVAEAADEARKDPELRRRLEALGFDMPTQTTPELFDAFLAREAGKMQKVVKAANIQA